MPVPEKPALEGLEAKWAAQWEASGTYRFDRTRSRDEVYSIDTPPPTVSGSLHVGHVFSFTHTDLVARFHRMRGENVFYPMGWDDNGLPTERRVQNYFNVRCDPKVPVEPGLKIGQAPEKTKDAPRLVSRPNFIELCLQLTHEDEEAFKALFRRRAGRGGRPADARCVPPRRVRRRGRWRARDRDHAPGAAGGVRRRDGASRRRALQAALREACPDAALPRPGADLPERARRSRE